MPTKLSQSRFTTEVFFDAAGVGVNYDHTTYSVPASAVTDEKSGFDNPGWRDMIKRHAGATTGFSAKRVQVFYRPSSIRSFYDPLSFGGPANHWIDITYKGAITDPGDWFSVSPGDNVDDNLASAQNLALQRFYGEIRKARSAFQGGTFLGEIRETLELIRHPARTLRRSLDQYATRSYKRVRTVKGFPRGSGVVPPTARRAVAKVLQDSWLEYSLGVMPLVRDIQAGYDLLKQRGKAFQSGDTVELQAAAKYAQCESFPYGTFICNRDTFSWTASLDRSGDVRYKGAIWGRPYGCPLGDSTLWGLDRTSFFPTLWEIMPYSFLIDYFTNVGDVVDAWSMGAVTMAWSQMTVRQRSASRRLNMHVIVHDPWTLSNDFQQGEFSVNRSWVTRVNLGTQLDLPSLAFNAFPGYFSQALNLGALLNLQGVKARRWPAFS